MKTTDDALREVCLCAHRNALRSVRRKLTGSSDPVAVLREQLWVDAYYAQSRSAGAPARLALAKLMRAVDRDRSRAVARGLP